MPISSSALGSTAVSLRSFGTTPFVGGDSAVIIPNDDELVVCDYHNGLVVLLGTFVLCQIPVSGRP